MIPLYHDFEGEIVLVVGGGTVGARKARRFGREAEVVVVAPNFPADDYGDADLVRAEPTPAEIDGWFERTEPALAVAATDEAAVNDAVERAARERGVLLNRADRSGGREFGSVVVPATIRDGDVVVSVSTGGASPALSKELRRRIGSELDGAGHLAAVTGELREELKERDLPPETRREIVRTVVGSERVWKGLEVAGPKRRSTIEAAVEAVLEEHT